MKDWFNENRPSVRSNGFKRYLVDVPSNKILQLRRVIRNTRPLDTQLRQCLPDVPQVPDDPNFCAKVSHLVDITEAVEWDRLNAELTKPIESRIAVRVLWYVFFVADVDFT